MLDEALARGAASVVLPIYQMTGVVYALAGVFLLGERGGSRRKLLSAMLTMTGCVIVVGSSSGLRVRSCGTHLVTARVAAQIPRRRR